jgi:benzoyl-CoA reductase subunit C
MLAATLERESIPYTEFKYAENTGQFQVIKEQTGTFSDSIKLWGQS